MQAQPQRFRAPPQTAGLGHNNPPSESEILKERLAAYEAEQAEYERLAATEVPAELASDDQAGRLSDHLKAIRLLAKTVGEIHKKEKAPFLEAGRVADAWKNDFEKRLKALVEKADDPLIAWNKKKEAEERARQLEIARKAREAADKLAAEAAVHEAEDIQDTAQELMQAAIQEEQKAAMIVDNAYQVTGKTRTGFSSSSIKRTWTGEIESMAAIDLETLRPYLSEDDVLKALNRAVRDGKRDIRGARIFQKEQLANR